MIVWPRWEQASLSLVSGRAVLVPNIPTDAGQMKLKVPTRDHPHFPRRI